MTATSWLVVALILWPLVALGVALVAGPLLADDGGRPSDATPEEHREELELW